MNPRSTRNGPSRSGAALIHRGPQALNVASANYAAQVHAPNAALLIDFDNVTMGIRSDLGKELRTLLGSDIIKGKVAVQRAYADWRRYPQYMVPLAESSIDTIQATAYGSSKKNATEVQARFSAEVIVDRCDVGAGVRADVAHRDVVESVLGEQVGGDVEQPLSRLAIAGDRRPDRVYPSRV